MSRMIQIGAGAVLLAMALAAGRVWAEDAGQADLDKATEAKLNAQKLNDLAEVIRLLETALEKGLDEGNTQFANNLLGSTLIQRGTIFAKLASAGRAVDPKSPEHRTAALEDLERGLKFSPQHPEALFLVARLNLMPGGDPKRAAEALDKAIESAVDEPRLKAQALTLRAGLAKDPEKKLADLDEAIRLVPHDVLALRTRGLLLAGRDKLQPALDDINKALELTPNHPPSLLLKAIVLSELKQFDEALVCLDKVHELLPDAVEPLMQMARIHSAEENFHAALHVLDQALAGKPGNVEVLLARAQVYQQLEDTEKALADVDAVLRLDPDLQSAVWFRALLLAKSDRFDQAVIELEQRRREHPEDLQIVMQLAMLHVAEKKCDRAIEYYSEVLAEKPDHWLALHGRGDALLNVGKHEAAIADYEKALKSQPEDTGILNNLAWVLATSPDEKLRDGKRAIELATKACELTKYSQGHILSTLASGYAETGDFDTAIKWIKKGLEVATEEQKEPLSEELESYQAGKPWRELLDEGERPKEQDKPEETDSDDTAPEQTEPDETEPAEDN